MPEGFTLNAEAVQRSMRAEVAHGLSLPQKELAAKYFYDTRGSALFEEITQLPEYYLTRAEKYLLRCVANELVNELRPRTLIELGPGAGGKNRILLRAMHAAGVAETYVPLDVSETYLAHVAEDVRSHFPQVSVKPTYSDISVELRIPERLPAPKLFAFLGSTIGNFAETEATALLARVREQMQPEDGLLLGFDLQKDVVTIEAAYNDSRGITAEFNRNVLVVLNRELGSDFVPEEFEHRAFYNRSLSRIEMHLVAKNAQCVTIPEAGEVSIATGESIRTEISCKYDRATVQQLFDAAGLTLAHWLTGQGGLFALALGRPEP
jgi:L-histidine N-alpha-methyltransferase